MRQLLPLYPLLLVVAILVRAGYVITAVLALGVFGFLSILQLDSTASHLSVERIHSPRGFVGDDLSVSLLITNTSRFPVPWLELADAVPLELRSSESGVAKVVTVGGRQSEEIIYRIHCHKRGLHRIGPLRITTGTIFGPLTVRLPELPPGEIIVYPEIWPVERLGLPARSPVADLVKQSSPTEDPFRVIGVRDYRSGDSPRHIEWSASARSDRLLVKQFSHATSRDLMLCVDLCRARHERWTSGTDLAVNTAASIAYRTIATDHLAAGLLVHGHDPHQASDPFWLPRNDHGHLMSLLEYLARIQETSEDGFQELLNAHITRFPFGSTVMVITGTIDDPLLGLLGRLADRGHSMAVGLVQARPNEPRRIGKVPVFHINDRTSVRDLTAPGEV